tara:strand:+ start:5247 stop:5852 length:606 start_codon:yes stop_codon:yes gene_type:complete
MNKQNKIFIRKKFQQIRVKELKAKEKLIYQQVEDFLKIFVNISSFNRKQYIGIYWPLNGEVDLRNLRTNSQLQFALPCTNPKGIIQYREWTIDPLKKDAKGIPSPLNETLLMPEDIGIIFVPAVAIDKNGNRLGYGGGCFDRLREDISWRSIPSFVVLPNACVLESILPIDSWDIPFDGWITEDGQSKKIAPNLGRISLDS